MDRRIATQTRSQSEDLRQHSIKESDIFVIWDALAYFIREEMSKKRGILIPGFGTFTFVEKRLEVGNNKQILTLKPFFMMSEKFSKNHAVKYDIEPINHAIPTHRINYAAIAAISQNYTRIIVERVLKEAFVAMQHFLRQDGHIRVNFNGLGKFQVHLNELNRSSHFEFFPVFEKYLPQKA